MNTSQNSRLSLASLNDTLSPLVIINLSVSVGFEIMPLALLGLIRDTAITGINKLRPKTRIRTRDPQ